MVKNPTKQNKPNDSTASSLPAADVYAFGDFHGDYERFRGLLQGAGVAVLPADGMSGGPDKWAQVQWLGGNAVVVIVGDVVCRGPQPYSIYVSIAVLRELAAKEVGEGLD